MHLQSHFATLLWTQQPNTWADMSLHLILFNSTIIRVLYFAGTKINGDGVYSKMDFYIQLSNECVDC